MDNIIYNTKKKNSNTEIVLSKRLQWNKRRKYDVRYVTTFF